MAKPRRIYKDRNRLNNVYDPNTEVIKSGSMCNGHKMVRAKFQFDTKIERSKLITRIRKKIIIEQLKAKKYNKKKSYQNAAVL